MTESNPGNLRRDGEASPPFPLICDEGPRVDVGHIMARGGTLGECHPPGGVGIAGRPLHAHMVRPPFAVAARDVRRVGVVRGRI